jgi:ribonuclease HII
VSLAEVPLGELRRRFAPGAERPTPVVLGALRADPRAGARALAEALERRRERDARESRRLEKLSRLERAARAEGAERIAGVDEVGVGPLAGPLVAAAVVLPPRARLVGLDDSKRLSRVARARLDGEIRAVALGVSLGWTSLEEIDRLNVYRAGLVAMRRAVEGLPFAPDVLFVDARALPDLPLEQHSVAGGDARVACVAAASIVAKVYRDAWMRDLDRRHPGYGFARNAGYGTAEHLEALAKLGPCPAHRHACAPVREAAGRRCRAAAARRRTSPTS